MCSWGKLWTTWYKKTKNLLLRCWGQKSGGCSMISANGTTKGVGTPPKALSSLTLPAPHLRDQFASLQGVSKGNYSFFCCLCEALPDFFLWPLINFYWLRSTITLVRNNININYQGQTNILHIQEKIWDGKHRYLWYYRNTSTTVIFQARAGSDKCVQYVNWFTSKEYYYPGFKV